jgi:hypothetical protein
METGEEESCLVDSAATNSILRETKYFQTLRKRTENLLTITGSNGRVIGSDPVEPSWSSLIILGCSLTKLSCIREPNAIFLLSKTFVVVVTT